MMISMTKQNQRCQCLLRVYPREYHGKQCRRLLTDQGVRERHIYEFEPGWVELGMLGTSVILES